MNRRENLRITTGALSGLMIRPLVEMATAGNPISPGQAVVRQPLIDLQFGDHRGLAQWWLPETLLLGNTDENLRTQVPAKWEEVDDQWRYSHIVARGQLSVSVTVERINLGWVAALTVGNQTDKTWSEVVCPVCLLLHASGTFQDPTWKRTFYRSEDEFLAYQNRETIGGQDIYRMSLVDGQQHLERSERHRNKWGFTTDRSDDGIIAVVSQDRSTVLTTTWKPTHHLQANRKRTYSCIHANPYFGQVAPGESRTRHGCVLLVAGSLEKAWGETNRLMKDYP